jgi:hypothetical protein
MHVAADNYFAPTGLGVAADAATGIKANDYKTAEAYEKRKLTKEQSVAELEKSFAHLKKAFTDTPAAKMSESIKLYGANMTVQSMMIGTVTHLHEHLGQMIAYARSNNVVPPWSQ